MSVVDKLDAARHSITGSNLAKIACKATSREVMGPKRKHVDYLIQCTNTDNVSIPNLAEILFERCTNSSWVVVFKSLCTFHHLMSYGNERFIQYMASRTTCFSLHSFLDKSGVQGYDMSTFVRRYSSYLNEKACSYREIGYDFCRVKRGKEDGVLRTMDSTKLLKALPVLQKQVDTLLEVDIKSTELSNGVINCAFVLLFKDLIRLFACYNDGIINMLEKYFDMPKKDCKLALDIYKRFVTRMDRVSEFLKTAEDVGFDKDDIPDLSKAPNSLLDALENHYQALEKGKTTSSHKPLTIPSITVPKVASDAFSAGGFSTTFDDTDTPDMKKKQLIAEEERHLDAFKTGKEPAVQYATIQLPKPQGTQPQPAQPIQQQAWQTMGEPTQPTAKATSPSDDLLQLNTAFAAAIPPTTTTAFSPSTAFPSQPFPGTQPAFQGGTAPGFGAPQWGGPNAASGFETANSNPFETVDANADFDQVFGSKSSSAAPAMESSGVLQPVIASDATPNLVSQKPTEDLSLKGSGDLQTSIERMAKSLDAFNLTNGNVKSVSGKTQHQWTPAQPQVKTGGPNWQKQNLASTTTVPPASAPPTWGGATPPMGPPGGMYRPPFGQPPMAQPTGQGMFPSASGFGSQPFQSVSPQPQMQQAADPFGPIPGTQARF